MTLSEAKEAFDAHPNRKTADDLVDAAIEYFADQQISTVDLSGLLQQAAPYRREERKQV